MTGPGHYEEAERLAAKIDRSGLKPDEMWVVHLTQVHATLALAAATAELYAGDAHPDWIPLLSGETAATKDEVTR